MAMETFLRTKIVTLVSEGDFGENKVLLLFGTT